MNRHRKINLKTDKAIIGGVKSAAKGISNIGKKIDRGISGAIDKAANKISDKLMKRYR